MKERELVYGEGTILEHGYGIVAKIAMTDRELSTTAKALYAYLCSYADSHNRAFPSVEKIKADLNLGKNTLYKYMRELRKAGYIVVSQSRDNGGKWSRNVYSIALIPQHTPYPKKRDTVERDTAKRDTVFGDTKITSIKSTIDQKVPEEEANTLPPDVTTEERLLLSLLREIYPAIFDYVKDLEFIRRLAVDYPTVNLVEEVKNWQTWLMDRGDKRPKNFRLAFRNWCRIASDKMAKKGGRPSGPSGRYPAERSKYADLIIS